VHRQAEQDQPITAETLTATYRGLLADYYGGALDLNELTGITWARIPHFFNSPYYVYQYATCFASAARISSEIMHGTEQARNQTRERYLTLLRAGGNDYPMEQLKKAGIDLSQPDTVRAIVQQLDDLVTRLEIELKNVKS
jgi:oligoendopeptidase F